MESKAETVESKRKLSSGRMVLNLAKLLLDILYPRYCLACEMPLKDRDYIFCIDCFERIQFIEKDFCPRCGKQLGPYSKAERDCLDCRGKVFHIKRIYAVFSYEKEGSIAKIIDKFKYGRRQFLARYLSKFLIKYLDNFGVCNRINLVSYVPLYWRRLRRRGFNQSKLLARFVAKHFRKRLFTSIKKIRDTEPQVWLPGQERLKNLEDAFYVKKSKIVEGKNILIIDDISTTGATVSECAKAFKNAGAKEIFVGVLAR